MADSDQPQPSGLGKISVRIASSPQIDTTTPLASLKAGIPIEYIVEGENNQEVLNLLQMEKESLARSIAEYVASTSTSFDFQDIVFEEGSNRIKVLLNASPWVNRHSIGQGINATNIAGAYSELNRDLNSTQNCGLYEIIGRIRRWFSISFISSFEIENGEGIELLMNWFQGYMNS